MHLFIAFLFSFATATTFLASSPVTNVMVIGADKLAAIEARSYEERQAWADQYLNKCGIVQETVRLLGTATCGNKVQTSHIQSIKVQAGGFEAVTDPTYLFTLDNSMNAADVAVLDNAVAYVLSQFGNGRFSLTQNAFNDGFTLPYMKVNFNPIITQASAARFFDLVGTIDYRCWNQSYAGFTQIDEATTTGLWFLQPSVDSSVFVAALNGACAAWNNIPGAAHCDISMTAPEDIQVAFTQNNWGAHKNGFAFLHAIKQASGSYLSDTCVALLEEQRVKGLRAALNFATTTTPVRPDACELYSGEIPAGPLQSSSTACPRNLDCGSCLLDPRCIFEKSQSGKNPFGVCRPKRKVKESDGHAESLATCQYLPAFPTLSTAVLNDLTKGVNNKCTVTGVTGENIYVAATIAFTTSGSVSRNTCINTISGVMVDYYPGIAVSFA